MERGVCVGVKSRLNIQKAALKRLLVKINTYEYTDFEGKA